MSKSAQEKRNICTRKWRKKNKEKCAAYNKKYYAENREKMLKFSGDWKKTEKGRETHNREERERCQMRHRTGYYERNKEKIAQGRRIWYVKNRWRGAFYAARRRAFDKALKRSTVQSVYEDNIKRNGTLTCVLCSKPISFGEDSLEHLTPLSRGGSNDFENLDIAHLHCNRRKYTKTLEEWREFTSKTGYWEKEYQLYKG